MSIILPWVVFLLCMRQRVSSFEEKTYEAVERHDMSIAGQEFLLYPGLSSDDQLANIGMLTVMPYNAPRVTVRVITPRLNPALLNTTLTLLRGVQQTVQVPASLRIPSRGTSDNSIYVWADHDVQIYLLCHGNPSHVSITWAVPITWAGTHYVFPIETEKYAYNYYMAIATVDDTRLTTFFVDEANTDHTRIAHTPLTYDVRGVGHTAGPKQDFAVVLRMYEMFFISTTSLSGYQVRSSHPIMVVSGFAKGIGNQTLPQTTQNQPSFSNILPAVSLWGHFYLCVGLRGHVNVMTYSPHTIVTVKYCREWRSHGLDGSIVTLVTSSSVQVQMADNCGAKISSFVPLHLLQMTYATGVYPSFVFSVVPREKFLSTYTFIICLDTCQTPAGVKHLLYIFIKGNRYGLRFLGDHTLGKPVGEPVILSGHTWYSELIYEAREPTRITVYHALGQPFVVYYLVKHADHTAMLPGGMGHVHHTWRCTKDVPVSVPGDDLDNDCDNKTDEEISLTSDLDKDGLFGEDITTSGRVSGEWGKWREWTCNHECDVTEIRRRVRFCDSPKPKSGGHDCYGSSYQFDAQCVGLNGSCISDCEDTKWGDACANNCSERCRHGVCDTVDGSCTLNCSAGYRGRYCDLPCPRNTYGINCVRLCSTRCFHGNCDPVSGACHKDMHGIVFFITLFPVFMFVPMVVILLLVKFGRSTSKLMLLKFVKTKCEILDDNVRLLEKRNSVTSSLIRQLPRAEPVEEWEGTDLDNIKLLKPEEMVP